MGYHVQYPGPNYSSPRKRKKGRPILMFILILLLFGAAVIPTSRAVLLELMIPGDAKVTAAAVEGLIGDMRQGERFDEAFTVFCEMVLNGGHS